EAHATEAHATEAHATEAHATEAHATEAHATEAHATEAHATEAHATEAHATGWLCLDTETSGLAGGTGTWAFLTGLLRADGREWLLRQYLLTRLDAEPVYLDLLAAELTRPAALLTYNGRAFDAPLLATRFRLANRTDPLAGLPHLDLLGPTRRAFARRWPDCRLVTAESRLLGFQRSGDLPGAAAPAAWLGWLRRGETAPLAAVLRHNRDDLLSLAGLLPALAGVYRDPAAHGADCRTVAAAWQRRDPARALRILAANRQDLDAAGLHDLARLYRRGGDWVQASGIWEALAARGDATARAALARYCEHHRGDLTRALALAESLPPGPERERRQARLRVKLGRERPAGQIELAIEPYSTGT
ncbi:ribonuclease H-like domain-containing protein, partial [uncultured Lamprocystis sp.]|uniref:ribonuclease H-like domain-containing protein n=3 Tax=uncultured Lamprocystis sp. TaxID=543132 RepID=UPI0025D4CC14